MSLILLLLSSLLVNAAHLPKPRAADCQPLYITFADSFLPRELVPISHSDSYDVSDGGLHMYLERPGGDVRTKDGVNDKVADGATFNSTFAFLYGKVTYELIAPTIPGVVTAAILIADEGDEMDIELLGSDPSHFQSNIFAPKPNDRGPLYGVFSSVDDIPDGTTKTVHSYSIDWNAERIIWSVDGKDIRTLRKDQTMYHGVQHFPSSHPTRIQLGIWDASSPAGTAAWAHGPIDWKNVPRRMEAVVKSVKLECT
ncbi:glycoside hydrolase family 16 protein [Neolentinus lepideus HHB14362 ss-1]|uniref:Glycoside hydrolase family 16 protein n=1 Tax=Neolentinus lepideus HHB14362 ss-1 TaxID=1314782 RepID=A0A165PKJ0_9AGAM|nr:glycoside hydrolase family 16 protein [Neolentinus lepideus HHB14362 ss-1]